VRLPDKGIVVVTGRNGAGKSSGFIESLTTCCWGKSLRSASMWFPLRKGYIDVELEAVTVKRTFDGKKASLLWSVEGKQPEQYETTTKAQDALARTIGTFDVWRKTCVFSSQDASHFTRATDTERKRLLEELLNLDQFNTAFEAATKEARSLKGKLTEHEKEIAVQLDRVEFFVREAKQTEATLANKRAEYEASLRLYESVDLASIDVEIDELHTESENLERKILERQQEVRAVNTELRDFESKINNANRTISQLEGRMGHLKAHFESFAEAKCPTCEQLVDDIKAATKKKDLKAEYKVAKEDRDKLKVFIEAAVEQARVVESKVETLLETQERDTKQRTAVVNRISKLQVAKNHVVVLEKAVKEHEDLVQKYTAAALECKETAKALKASTRDTEKHHQVIRDSCDVLGVSGFRAALLSEILDTLAIMANKWLERLTGKAVHVALTPYSESKTGAVTDALSLQILGLGLEDYRSLSGGERRRVDIAMLFALADVSAAAFGAEPGTLFLDEVTDAPLDDEGADMLCDAMLELSKTRPIVAICHSSYAIGRLKPRCVEHYHVEDGKISTRL
jgi:DNA repair exonuclease SbcCD ATPase subunit